MTPLFCWSRDQRPKDRSQGQRSNQEKTVLSAAKGAIEYEKNWLPFIRPLDTFTTVASADCSGRAVAVHRPGSGGRAFRGGRSLFSRSPLRSATRVAVSTAFGGRRQNEKD